MQDNKPDLALSRTFRCVNGVLSAADQAEQWAQALSLHAGALKATLSRGEIVDSKYRILALVGEGGMGSVYKVQHMLLDKEMALKTFSAATLTPDALQRFQREAQAIAKLTHVNIVQVFDFGIGRGNVPYYTMELLSGQSLADKRKSHGRLSIEEALPFFSEAAAALSHAHKHGIVHRDVKPANIFLDQGKSGKPVVKVVDFGIAKLATSQNIDGESQRDSGLVFGSPLYMSPEQSMGEPTDHRTDIYSYGCSLFEVLTGEPPFLGENAFETISLRLNRMPPHLVDAAGGTQFSQSAEALVERLLAKDTAKRYQSFEEVLTDLAKVSVKVSPTVASGSKPARQSKDRVRLLLENTQDNEQANVQGETGPLTFHNKQLAIVGSCVLGFVALALVAGYFFTTKNQSLPKTQAAELMTAAEPAGASFYSHVPKGGGMVFHFPDDTLIGTIRWDQNKPNRADGVVIVPRGVAIEFEAGAPLLNKPELFAHFRPDDIARLHCDSSIDLTWTGRQLEYITRYLTELVDLDFKGARIDGASIEILNRLKHLRYLDISDTQLTGGDLVRLERLPDLISLEASQINDMHVVLEKLKGSAKLMYLTVDDCGLTDADMEALGGIPSLVRLQVQRNQISIVGLRHLTKLTKLEYFSIGGAKLGPECIDLFHSFKHLNFLRLSQKGWPKTDIARLKNVLPSGCLVEASREEEAAEKDFRDQD